MAARTISDAMMANIRTLEGIIARDFTKPNFAEEALAAPGSIYAWPYIDGNCRLALIGDACLRQILVLDGYRAGANKGGIQAYLNDAISNTTLRRIGHDTGLRSCMAVAPGQWEGVTPRQTSDAVEAVLGAVYLDAGCDLAAVRLVMANLGMGWPH